MDDAEVVVIVEGKIFPNFTAANAHLNNELLTWTPPEIVRSGGAGVRTVADAISVTGALVLTEPMGLTDGRFFLPRAGNRFRFDFIDSDVDILRPPFESAQAAPAQSIAPSAQKAKAR